MTAQSNRKPTLSALAAVAALSMAGAALAQTPAFVPPPRTIADITAILDQQKPDPAKAAALRAAADAQPAPGLAGRALADFLVKRAEAAELLGRTRQRLEDLRAALKLARAGQGDLSRALQYLAVAESNAGNLKTAAEMRAESARSSPRDRKSTRLNSSHSQQSRMPSSA